MNRSRCFVLITALLVITVIFGLGMVVTPAAASTATYSGTSTVERPIIERATNTTSGFNLANNTSLGNTGIPPGGWTGYNMTTTFSNILRNADYVTNGQYATSSSPWYFYSNNGTIFSSAYSASPPSGTSTHAVYVRLQGKELAVKPLSDMNFSSYPIPTWKNSTQVLSSGGTWPNIYNSTSPGGWLMEGYYKNNGSVSLTTQANLYLDQNFTYSGVTPPDYAAITYQNWISNWTNMVTANGSSIYYGIILRYFGSNGTTRSYTLFNNTASGRTYKQPYAINTNTIITNYLTATGKWGIRLFAKITLNIKSSRNIRVVGAVAWTNVGVYIRWGAYTAGNYAEWKDTFTMNQAATGNSWLIFKYWTNITSILPSTNSYLVAWVNSTGQSVNQYNIIAFSSITTGSWQRAAVNIPSSVFNYPGSQVSIGVGIYLGSPLEVNATSSSLWGPRFYFDNATFFIQYQPTPANIKLRINDVLNNENWNYTAATATTAGSGTVIIVPTPPRSQPWSPASDSVPFLFRTNATNGKSGYNQTIFTFTYTSTLYANRYWRWTNYVTFTVSDTQSATWYLNYSVGTTSAALYLGGCQNYNISVYVPADWLNTAYQGGISQIHYAGYSVSAYTTSIVNSTTAVVRIPASVFAPDPPKGLLEIWFSAANYLGPSQIRTLLVTQVYNKYTSTWTNATSFGATNQTRLVCYIRNGSNKIPSLLNRALFTVSVRLYNQSKGAYNPSLLWTGSPSSTNWNFTVQLSPWNGASYHPIYNQNVTYFAGGQNNSIRWYFAVNCTNGFEAGCGIAKFNTSYVPSSISATILTSPKQPYTATYYTGFTLMALYNNATNGNSTGIMGATLTWKWMGPPYVSPQPMTPGAARGNYTATITGPAAFVYFNSTEAVNGISIQINASRPKCISQTIQVKVYVIGVATSGSVSSFPVPYETYDWNSTVQTSLIYSYTQNGSSIHGATLYVNKTASGATVGSSGIRWWFTYDALTGTYRIFFNATQSTPTGLSSWSFNVSVYLHYFQNLSFNLNGFQIQNRPTSYSAPYLTYTVPWNDTAIFLVTFRDTDAGGSAIPGATATCTWTTQTGNPYTVIPLSNRTYEFLLSDADLPPQTIGFTFSLSSPHFVSISGISGQVVIRIIRTSLSSPSSTITMYWGNNQTALLIYEDLDNNVNISTKASWSLMHAYSTQTGTDYVANLVYNIYLNTPYNSWIIRVNGSLPVGSYTLWINFSVPIANGYYTSQLLYLPLNVNSIPTSLTTQFGATLTVVWSNTGTIIVSYTDTNHSVQVSGGNVAVLVDPSISWSAVQTGNGIYTITLNTTYAYPRAQLWYITVILIKTNYAESEVSCSMQINAIPMSVTVPSQEIEVAYGQPITFSVYVEDLNHSVGVYDLYPPLTVRCNWTASGWMNYYQDFNNGWYLFNLTSTLEGTGQFTIIVQASQTYYTTAINYYSFIVGIVNTSLAPHSVPASVPWGDNAGVTVDYDVNGTTTWVTDATIVTNWTLPYTYWLTATGQWGINFTTTGLPEGIYSININATRQYYENESIVINLTIRSIDMEMRLYQLPDKVQQGNTANITVQLWDLDHLRGVTGASLLVNGLNASQYHVKELGNGYYELLVYTASMSAPKNITFTIGANESHYLLTAGPSQVLFHVIPPAGFTTAQVIMVGGGSGGIVILGVLGFIMFRRARRPYVIKKIEQSLKLINKGEQVEPIEGLRSRTDIPLSLLAPDLESLGVAFKLEEPKIKEKKEGKPRKKKAERKDAKPKDASKDTKANQGGS